MNAGDLVTSDHRLQIWIDPGSQGVWSSRDAFPRWTLSGERLWLVIERQENTHWMHVLLVGRQMSRVVGWTDKLELFRGVVP